MLFEQIFERVLDTAIQHQLVDTSAPPSVEFCLTVTQVLKYTRLDKDGYKLYQSDPSICQHCPLLDTCTKSQSQRKVITRHIWQNYLETVEDIRHTEIGRIEYKKRSQTIERRFGDAKEQHGLRWTRHRRIKKVFRDTTLICACMNLKKMAMWLTRGSQLG